MAVTLDRRTMPAPLAAARSFDAVRPWFGVAKAPMVQGAPRRLTSRPTTIVASHARHAPDGASAARARPAQFLAKRLHAGRGHALTDALQQPLAFEFRPWRWQNSVEPGWKVVTTDDGPNPPRSPYTYEDFQDAIARAGRDPEPAARVAFLTFFNTHAAPRLTVEEAALQFVAMRIAYMHLPHRCPLQLHIERDLENVTQDTYARHYHLADTLIDRHSGVVAYYFQPDSPHFGGRGKRTIIVFRGTARGSWRDVLTLDHPEGVQADFDVRGIAHRAFAANRGELVGWVRDALQAGRGVTITGHSLGGAKAARLMAALEPSEQARCSLITFNAPGLDRPTAEQIVAGKVHQVINWADLVPRAGEVHPPIARAYNPVFENFIEQPRSHGVPQLARQQLTGKQVKTNLKARGWDDNLFPIEQGRKWLGMLLGGFLMP